MNRTPRVAGVGAVGGVRPYRLVPDGVGRGTGGRRLSRDSAARSLAKPRGTRDCSARGERGTSVAIRVRSAIRSVLVERRLPGEEVVERRPHGVDVRAHVQSLTPELLGRGELRRPLERAALRELASSSRAIVEIDSPKSPTFTVPSRSTKQFAGLMSRCRMPPACAASQSGDDLQDRIDRFGWRERAVLAYAILAACRLAKSSIAMTGVPAISSLPKM